jgi:tRNA(Ile)-lysidine synthase
VATADGDAPLDQAEIRSLFADLAACPALVLAVSGGPDSTALLLIAARWRKLLKAGPKLLAVTVDHGLRKEARREALAVAKLARSLGVKHRTLRWTGRKPVAGLQEAARLARYGFLAKAAKAASAHHVLTAHTLDDQAETVLIRLTRGSGVTGLAAMARVAPLPTDSEITLIRPLLDVRKARLTATLRKARVSFADDPSNRNPRFTRVRFRAAMPALEREGLGAERLALLARRARRADTALEAAVDEAEAALWPRLRAGHEPIAMASGSYAELPAEVALRLLGRAIAAVGTEGPVELGKLEALHAGLAASPDSARFRRTLAGAIVTQAEGHLTIEQAPPRRGKSPRNGLNQTQI